LTELSTEIENEVVDSLKKFDRYVRENNFSGFDPYDALNSEKLLKINNKLLRVLLTQFFVYSPFNTRSFFQIKSEKNPKAIGLFLSSYCRLYQNNQINKKGVSPPENCVDPNQFIYEIVNRRNVAKLNGWIED